MPGPFDPNDILKNVEDQAKQRADEAIDNLASKVPGGEQFAQQAKDTVNQGIDQAGQAGIQQAQQQLGGMGGVGQQLGGMLGGGQGGSQGGNQGAQDAGGQNVDPNAGGQGNDPNAGNQGGNW